MEIRKGWPLMGNEKRSELESALRVLHSLTPFDKAILYGQYAEGNMFSLRGGYELLLVTRSKPQYEGWELEKKLTSLYKYEIREDTRFHIETACIHYINQLSTSSWFYTNVRNEGNVIFDTSESPKIFTRNGFRSAKAYKETKRFYNYYFGLGSNFLDEAERIWEDREFQRVALMLYYGALFLFRTMETVFYGNHIAAENIWRSFKRARHFSEELLEEFTAQEKDTYLFFDDLGSLRQIPHCKPLLLTTKKYKAYIRRLRTVQEIVKLCSERHLAALRSGLLGSVPYKERE